MLTSKGYSTEPKHCVRRLVKKTDPLLAKKGTFRYWLKNDDLGAELLPLAKRITKGRFAAGPQGICGFI